MPRKFIEELEEKKHIHRWIYRSAVEYYCDQMYKGKPCIALKVKQHEYDHIVGEWDNYYNIVTHTRAYQLYRDMSTAVSNNDKKWIKQLKKEVDQRLGKKDDSYDPSGNWEYKTDEYWPKPSKPDPRVHPYEVFL